MQKVKEKEPERTNPRLIGHYLGGNYAQLQGLIKQADTKANIIIALIGALASMFFNFFTSESNQLMTWQIIIIISLLLISGVFAISVLFPRSSKPTGRFSLTFYKDAQRVDTSKWTKKLLSSDEEETITKDLMDNIKNISFILDKKFSGLRIAYLLFSLAILSKVIFDLLVWLS